MMPLPRTPGELLTEPTALPAVFDRISALRRLRLDIVANGSRTTCALQISPRNALLSAAFSLNTLDPETIVWRDAILAADGVLAADSIALADALIRAIKRSSFNSKIVYLLPLLGGNLAAARMPLRDSLGVGIAASTGFTDSDFSEATGLQGDGTGKLLTTGLNASQVSGLGYWENNYVGAGSSSTVPIGGDANPGGPLGELYWLRNWSDNQIFHWGSTGGDADPDAATLAGAGSDGHYYGQRPSSTLRQLYKGGAVIASNTNSEAAPNAANAAIKILGVNFLGTDYYYPGRCAAAYLTDGTLTAAVASAFHTLLQTYLITPTGR